MQELRRYDTLEVIEMFREGYPVKNYKVDLERTESAALWLPGCTGLSSFSNCTWDGSWKLQ